MRLKGRVAIVTGAGNGIGAAVARRFAAEGASVLVAEVNEETGHAVADETGGLFLRTDLVNNAWAAGNVGRVEDKTDEMLARGLGIGFYGPFWAMQAVFPHMRDRGWGRVVNMCSLNGVNAHMGTLEYNAAKEALRTLTRTAAREWAPTGVVANAICPGAKSAAFRSMMSRHPELEAKTSGMNPMGRVGDPAHDIAPVALFLAGEDARYVTGNTVFVDGGAHINGVAWAPDLP
ncbi:SDR family NAD(P)-dependent oxidoreductase [Streptomyces sp. NBC_01320]|uniref:SDR family NAD(P)-dependent oxidoreductase n=1 Tax=Streptomyces sp. NBC_01320 TaxID=2903824 RepID=UPI002E160DAC|nr:SDR family oxidoreductase [Streptomyces sp. NBC_01320]